MIDNITLNSSPSEGPQFKINRNFVVVLGAFAAFALWLAATITLPKKVEMLESRLNAAENNYHALQSKMTLISEDIRDIKNLLMREKK